MKYLKNIYRGRVTRISLENEMEEIIKNANDDSFIVVQKFLLCYSNAFKRF